MAILAGHFFQDAGELLQGFFEIGKIGKRRKSADAGSIKYHRCCRDSAESSRSGPVERAGAWIPVYGLQPNVKAAVRSLPTGHAGKVFLQGLQHEIAPEEQLGSQFLQVLVMHSLREPLKGRPLRENTGAV